MFVFLHKASFFGSCLLNNQNQTFFCRLGKWLPVLDPFWFDSLDHREDAGAELTRRFPFWKLNIWALLHFFFFLPVYKRPQCICVYVLKSVLEFRTFHILFCNTFSSWWITCWIFNSELIVHEMFRCAVTCLWQVLGVAREAFHMSQGDMWSGYADQSFPGNLAVPYGDSLGSWRKMLEMRGLEPPCLQAIVCFLLSSSLHSPSF